MKPSTESNDWLSLLLWGLDILMNPNSQTLLDSFESWDYRNRLRLDLQQLRRSGMVECLGARDKSQWRLTARDAAQPLAGLIPYRDGRASGMAGGACYCSIFRSDNNGCV